MTSLPRILIAEDEPLVLMFLEETLKDLGCQVESVSTVGAALEAAKACDCVAAILDFHLHGERIDPVAAILDRRGIPYAISSGLDSEDIRSHLATGPMLPKPYLMEDVSSVLGQLLQPRVPVVSPTTDGVRATDG